jgi:hypothetical protein
VMEQAAACCDDAISACKECCGTRAEIADEMREDQRR